MKFFKEVKTLNCIFCRRDFPLDQENFRVMNRHGWGCCNDCWEEGYPDKTAANSVYLKPEVIAAMHNQKHQNEKNRPK